MNQSLSLLLTIFDLQLEAEHMPPQLGGFYRNRDGVKKIIVNDDLPYEQKVDICFHLIFQHCLDDVNKSFIPYYLMDNPDDDPYNMQF
ncbi:hypothetical protein [Gorillibacterium massiliense]|uniref:hypothetical protein n=1 Tax=Gorillibacterium massiliense TaxID=1280390 RepID=UPI0004B59E78|nr:hypothetical protein [Gorillibacterium massiliense]